MSFELTTVARGSGPRDGFWVEEFSGEAANIAAAGSLYILGEGQLTELQKAVPAVRGAYYGDPTRHAVEETLAIVQQAVEAGNQALGDRPANGLSLVAAVTSGRGELFVAYAGACQCFVYRRADDHLDRVSRREFQRSRLDGGSVRIGSDYRALADGDVVLLVTGSILDSVTESEIEVIAGQVGEVGVDTAAEMVLERVSRRDPNARATVVICGVTAVEADEPIESPPPEPPTARPADPDVPPPPVAPPVAVDPPAVATPRAALPALMTPQRPPLAPQAAVREAALPPASVATPPAFEVERWAADETDDAAAQQAKAAFRPAPAPIPQSIEQPFTSDEEAASWIEPAAALPRPPAEPDPLAVAQAAVARLAASSGRATTPSAAPVEVLSSWDDPPAARAAGPRTGGGFRFPLFPSLPFPKRSSAPAAPVVMTTRERDWSRYPRRPGPLRRLGGAAARILLLSLAGLVIAAVLIGLISLVTAIVANGGVRFGGGTVQAQDVRDGDLFTRPFVKDVAVLAQSAAPGAVEASWQRIEQLWPAGDAGDVAALQDIVAALEQLATVTPDDPRLMARLPVARTNLAFRHRMAEVASLWGRGDTTADTVANWSRVVELLEALYRTDLPADYRRQVIDKLYVGHLNAGRSLDAAGRRFEATGQYQRAREIDPARGEALEALRRR